MINDYENLELLHKNCLAARSWFIPVSSRAELARAGKFAKNSTRRQTLSGEWAFCLVNSPKLIDRAKEEDFKNTPVPSCWQAQGYGKPFYVNNDFTCPALPPHVPTANPVGIYRRTFDCAPPKGCERTVLTFLGVCSAFHVYINGKEVGYSQGSHQTSEFDVSGYLVDGENSIEVRVYKWSDGSYLESQDMFRYNGIFRDVYLTYLPKVSLFDFRFYTEEKEGGFDCSVKVKYLGEKTQKTVCKAELSESGKVVASGEEKDGEIVFFVQEPKRWNAEKPVLYDLFLQLFEGEEETECIFERVGFKTVDYVGPQFKVNGVPVKFKGVNMHESNPLKGYTLTDEECERDIRLAKSLNINTVRFSHYPPNPVMLRLCDEYGLYVIDEADLESYGSLFMEDIDYFGKAKEWLPAFIDRMEHLFERDKNHVSVVMWSMGNEAGRGENFDRCYEYLKSLDTQIPVQYETCFRYEGEKGYDLISLQYSDFPTIERWMNSDDNRPFYLCEYGHSMGLGPGSLKEYWEYVYRYDQFIGGCIWEWCDHAAYKNVEETDPKKFRYTYGGDHGEYVHDKNFCCDGIVYPDRRLSTSALEVKNAYRPIRAELKETSAKGCEIEFFNTNAFTDADEYRIVLRKKVEGVTLSEEEVPLTLAPYGRKRMYVPFEEVDGERGIETEVFRGGESVGFDSYLLERKIGGFAQEKAPKTEETAEGVYVTAGGVRWFFDSYLRTVTKAEIEGGKNVFSEEPKNGGYGVFCEDVPGMYATIWRAPTDNDRPYVEDWQKRLYDKMWISFEEEKTYEEDGKLIFEQSGPLNPPKYGENFRLSTKYIFSEEGLCVEASLTQLAEELPPIPRFSFRMQLSDGFDRAKWYGLGPTENYPDYQVGVRYGVYEQDAKSLEEPYIRPQENGSRGEIKRLEVFDGEGEGLCFTAVDAPFAFSLRKYALEDLEKAEHRWELPERAFSELSIDGFTRGVGSASCGMRPLEQYTIPLRKGETIRFGFAVTRRPKIK